ncbi:PAAR domain-containing protein [Acinetobacter gyllenbergii]|uniref:PAAR domain-containing protein n=1 Tax=Acinetobacter gyllenbergii TaxID=134534 RepID=UPI0003BE18E7|nr:PAAR domain-containing protein [Acinetobacter gyllenbergii]ESK36764.1 hypothetical protein F987_03577 [Acinetobacter gyllenbergii NIPH 230]
MAVGFAIHNSMTNHGGIIPATQMRTSQMGNLFLVAGDGHFCPKCKCWSKIIKSHDHIILDGKAVAYVGDQLTCGAKILPKQSHVVGESQGANYSSSSYSSAKTIAALQNNFVEDSSTKYGIQFQLKDEQTQEIFDDIPYSIIYKSTGEVETGWTDKEGKTHIINANSPDEVEFQTIDASQPLPSL